MQSRSQMEDEFAVWEEVTLTGLQSSLDGQRGRILGKASRADTIQFWIVLLDDWQKVGQPAIVLPTSCLQSLAQ